MECHGECNEGHESCGVTDPISRFKCTRKIGHEGPHIACGFTCNLFTWGWQSSQITERLQRIEEDELGLIL